ncbi:hypothetical protein CBOM_07118 [Ceraceosorus bombacis]|uniref:Uncharacterized protein n=1 Tax=Ceraceosorus bombacis TaxID=401625 RepID=A0A0P1B872_9BASI|nr:hypothetical protein CBOM_07118 [Ceraceosorus bombacis]
MAAAVDDRTAKAKAAAERRQSSQEAMRAQIRAARQAKQAEMAHTVDPTASASGGEEWTSSLAGAVPRSMMRKPSNLLKVPSASRRDSQDSIRSTDARHLTWYAEEDDYDYESGKTGASNSRPSSLARSTGPNGSSTSLASMASDRHRLKSPTSPGGPESGILAPRGPPPSDALPPLPLGFAPSKHVRRISGASSHSSASTGARRTPLSEATESPPRNSTSRSPLGQVDDVDEVSSDDGLSEVLHMSNAAILAGAPPVPPVPPLRARVLATSAAPSADEEEQRRQSLMRKSIGGLIAAVEAETESWKSNEADSLSESDSSDADAPRKRRKQRRPKNASRWGFEEQRVAPPTLESSASSKQQDAAQWAYYQFSPDLPPFMPAGLKPRDMTGMGTWRGIAARAGAMANASASPSVRGSTASFGSLMSLQSQVEGEQPQSSGPVSMRELAAQARRKMEVAQQARERQASLLAQRSFMPIDIHAMASDHAMSEAAASIKGSSASSIFSFDSSLLPADADRMSVASASTAGIARERVDSSVSTETRASTGTLVGLGIQADASVPQAPAKKYVDMCMQTSPTSSPDPTPPASPVFAPPPCQRKEMGVESDAESDESDLDLGVSLEALAERSGVLDVPTTRGAKRKHHNKVPTFSEHLIYGQRTIAPAPRSRFASAGPATRPNFKSQGGSGPLLRRPSRLSQASTGWSSPESEDGDDEETGANFIPPKSKPLTLRPVAPRARPSAPATIASRAQALLARPPITGVRRAASATTLGQPRHSFGLGPNMPALPRRGASPTLDLGGGSDDESLLHSELDDLPLPQLEDDDFLPTPSRASRPSAAPPSPSPPPRCTSQDAPLDTVSAAPTDAAQAPTEGATETERRSSAELEDTPNTLGSEMWSTAGDRRSVATTATTWSEGSAGSQAGPEFEREAEKGEKSATVHENNASGHVEASTAARIQKTSDATEAAALCDGLPPLAKARASGLRTPARSRTLDVETTAESPASQSKLKLPSPRPTSASTISTEVSGIRPPSSTSRLGKPGASDTTTLNAAHHEPSPQQAAISFAPLKPAQRWP